MAYRVLTDKYVLMRNNAITSRTVFPNDQYSDDKAALVLNLEASNVDIHKDFQKNPPEWINDVDRIQYEMTKVKNKIKELLVLHDKHLNRPTLDDNTEEESTIDLVTQEITRMLNHCQIGVKQISNRKSRVNHAEQRLITNVVNNLAKLLQDITINFRKSQSLYLKKIKSREERSKLPFESTNYRPNAILTDDFISQNDSINERIYSEQLQVLEENNAALLEERGKEIVNVVKSIQDLNDLFKDLASMVVDQGTVLDRIDCNIEKVSIHVNKGLDELKQASKYQKGNRKMYCIGILAIIVLVLFVSLIGTKFV